MGLSAKSAFNYFLLFKAVFTIFYFCKGNQENFFFKATLNQMEI